MKKLFLILAMACAAATFYSCKEESEFPYIPYEKDEQEIPANGEDAQSQTVNYKLGQVLLCDPANPNGIDICGKFDFFSTVTMSVIQSPVGMKVKMDKGTVPFNAWDIEIPEDGVDCELDMEVVPNELRVKDTETVIATFEKDGFTVSFQLDSDQLTYKYKFQSI